MIEWWEDADEDDVMVIEMNNTIVDDRMVRGCRWRWCDGDGNE